MKDFDLRKYLAENKLLKEEFVKGTPQYYVKYTTLDGKEVKSELMSKREAIYKERDLVDSGIKKSSVHKIQKNMDLNGKEYEIEYELDKDIEYRTDEEGKPIAENNLIDEKPYIDDLGLEKLYDIKNRYEKEGNPFEIDNEIQAYINSRIEKLESQQKYYNSKIGIWQYGVNKLSPEDLDILQSAQKSGKIGNKVGTRMSEPDMVISYNSGDKDIENLLKSIEKDPDYS
jgi:c-di-AMP phosphodiesterase-like protein